MENKKIGLALGGGAILGAAHIGVLKSLKENNIKVDYVSGTSIGAFVAAFYAFGKEWEEIEKIATELSWLDITAVSFSKFGLLSNKKIEELIFKYIGDKNLEDANIPVSMVATDASNGKRVVFTKGSVAKAVMASTCIPGIFIPVEYEEKLLLDGGLVENVPVDAVKELGAEYVIGVDLSSQYRYQKPSNIIDVLLNSFHFIMNRSSLYSRHSDLLIKPDLSKFSKTNTKQVKALFEKGYDDAQKILPNIKC